MKYSDKLIHDLRIQSNHIRQESIRMVWKAKSGHPGGSLSEAEILAALYFHVLNINPDIPLWIDRDRFILSKGHACPGLYAALALRGFFPIEELQTFRMLNSRLQGHPDMSKTPGVELSSGPLGNGLSGGVGIALGGRIQKKSFHTYVLIGEGDFQEGATWEAMMFAGFHKLNNLTCIFDNNDSQVDGPAHEVLDVNPIKEKWKAFNWDVLEIDGHNIPQILDALKRAKRTSGKPVAIIAKTTKGKGVSFMEDRAEWHGKAPNDEQMKRAIKELEDGLR